MGCERVGGRGENMENRENEGMEKQWRRGVTRRGVITENMDKAKTNEKEGKRKAREGEDMGKKLLVIFS